MRRASQDARRFAWLWFLAAAAGVALVPLARPWLTLAPACPLHALTGVPCFSCGTTRAAEAVLGGDVLGALAWNPLITLLGVTFVVGGLLAPVWIGVGAPLPRWNPRWTRPARIGVLLGIAANWIYLVLSGI